MKTTFKLLSLKGIGVYLHITLLAFIAWIVLLFFASGMGWTDLAWSAFFLVAIFASVILHEYGHALVAAGFGITATKITLYPIGGIATIGKQPENAEQELLISAAGPVVSFSLAGILMLFAPRELSLASFEDYSGAIRGSSFVYALGLFNIVLAVFNLIPAFPMDGGRILRGLLALRYNYVKATTIAATVGKVIAVFIVISGLLLVNLLLSLIGIFIILFAQEEESYVRLRSVMKRVHLRDLLMYDYDSIGATMTISQAVSIMEANPSHYFIVFHKGHPMGTLNREDVIRAYNAGKYDMRLGDLAKDTELHLEGDAEVEEVVGKLHGGEERIYPVYDKEKFLGVISLRKILEHLSLHETSFRNT